MTNGGDLLDCAVELQELAFLVFIEAEVVVEDVLLHRYRVVLVHVAFDLLAPHEQLDGEDEALFEADGFSLGEFESVREGPVEDESADPGDAVDHGDAELVEHAEDLVVELCAAEGRQVAVNELLLVDVCLVHENHVASSYGGGRGHLQVQSLHHQLEVVVDLQPRAIRQGQQFGLVQQGVEVLDGLRFELAVQDQHVILFFVFEAGSGHFLHDSLLPSSHDAFSQEVFQLHTVGIEYLHLQRALVEGLRVLPNHGRFG